MLRYSAISIVPAAVGKKVRDVAAKVLTSVLALDNIFVVWIIFVDLKALFYAGQSRWHSRKLLRRSASEWRNAHCG